MVVFIIGELMVEVVVGFNVVLKSFGLLLLDVCLKVVYDYGLVVCGELDLFVDVFVVLKV